MAESSNEARGAAMKRRRYLGSTEEEQGELGVGGAREGGHRGIEIENQVMN